ncbi:serine/threonine protein kinase [Gottfriedia acidiceleris]|uniref:serine/threonine protein kinase n=1 Tax=Gottfriedia acidiceleris TaxID=371036 RepID=UPI0033992C11
MNDYQERYKEEQKEQLALWKELVEDIFGAELTETKRVSDPNNIIKILNKIGKSKALNHTFFPSGGGLDLSGATFSHENGRIEINFEGSTLIVNPSSLSFNPIGDNPEWWYFRLNTLPFKASGVYEEVEKDEEENPFKSQSDRDIEYLMSFAGEELLEVSPGEYENRGLWDQGHLGYDENGDEIRIPRSARIVTRKTNGGAFVIFPKMSVYNRTSGTYDGRHNKMTEEQFHEHISLAVKKLAEKE